MDDGTYAVTRDIGDTQAVHQLVVAGSDLHAIHPGDNAVSAYLTDIADTAAVNLLAVGPLQAFADGMGGGI